MTDEGLFIAVEGIDGSGKTTQAGRLARWLKDRGIRTVLTAEPTNGPIGRLVREGLAGRVALEQAALALLFAADRLDHLSGLIEPALAAGEAVVSDRYLWSSLAYQSVPNQASWVREINRLARPADLTLLIDVPVDVGLKRLRARSQTTEIFERAGFLEAVRRNYLALADDWVRAGRKAFVMDGRGSPDEVEQLVRRAAASVMGMDSED